MKPIRSPFLSVNPEHAAEILNRHKTICAFIWVVLCGILYAAYIMSPTVCDKQYVLEKKKNTYLDTLPMVIPRINPK